MIYCRQNHPNPPENRFCAACGERLVQASQTQAGPALVGRYQILRELGQGGFGRTYLAADLNRFNEHCVLKEFAPQVQGDQALQQAEELFEREAGVFYQLQHPQIPRFRELFRAALSAPGSDSTSSQERLFLVQDYVEGSSYSDLLTARILAPAARPPYFSEAEIWRLLAQILPVLRYIHAAGVIHRDLAPDNLILRSRDHLPVLIDFGGVKQIAATATSNYIQSAETQVPARLSKQASPSEQMQQGVSPQTDLYALAVTALVLLSGKQALDLIDPTGQSHPWQQMLRLSPELTSLLTRMLSPQPAQQFASAEAVSLALAPLAQPALPQPLPMQTPLTSPLPLYPAPTQTVQTAQTVPVALPPSAPVKRRLFWIWLLPLLALLAVAYLGRSRWLPLLPTLSTAPDVASPSAPADPDASPISTPLSPLERRAQAANLDYGFLIKLTDAAFARRYPNQAGRSLSDRPEDAEWRQKWADLADSLLKTLGEAMSAEPRQSLGRYGAADRDQWKQRLNQHYVGSRSLYDLSDAQFAQHFPDWRDSLHDKDFLAEPIGQVWQAIAADQVSALETGKTLEPIEFAAGAFSKQTEGTLAAGEGRIYTANLASGQILRLNLQAPADSSLLSLYLPRPTPELSALLEDSTDTTWVGKLPQSGYYEVVIVNRASQPIRYGLTLAVDNVTSPPIKPKQAEAPEAKN